MLPDTTSKRPPTFFSPNRALEGKKRKKEALLTTGRQLSSHSMNE
jgi:hypothetical protein